ncbi:serine--tRNA ligase [Compostibacter hankyongensis]|uniref:Serine--tRNA ligase n=1 Tax=Compostibacter hankyongensis TaxID=1007089 RepID=A0ABP8FF05_9BACT
MLAIHLIREKKEWVLERLAVKHFKEPELVEKIVQLDEQRRKLKTAQDNLLAEVNTASRAIGALMREGRKVEAEASKKAVADLKAQLQPLEAELARAEQQQQELLLKLPNLPAPEVPPGRSPEDNVVVREGGTIPETGPGALPHWELAQQYDLMSLETGNKITGSGFPVYKNRGAKLQRALISYFLDYNIANGYTEYQPPLLVNEATAYGTGQLPDKEGQMYFVQEDGLYLIPTAEVPLTNIYRDEILKESELPVRMTGYTPCFRREAGSYGKDVRGLNRVHQFDKVEVVQLVHPAQSYAVLEQMVAHVEGLVQTLQLPYRILRLCGGDMSFTSAMTYDFEIYSAAQKRWLEVSSVSNFETFQTNRMKIRYKDAEGRSQLLHSLNGSALALPRIVACLLENNQSPEGILLPEALHPYFGADRIS